MKLPDKAARDLDISWIERGETVRVADVFVVDLLMNASGATYGDLQEYREVIDLDGIPVTTLNLEGLLRTKQSAREQDRLDRSILQRALEETKRNE